MVLVHLAGHFDVSDQMFFTEEWNPLVSGGGQESLVHTPPELPPQHDFWREACRE